MLFNSYKLKNVIFDKICQIVVLLCAWQIKISHKILKSKYYCCMFLIEFWVIDNSY